MPQLIVQFRETQFHDLLSTFLNMVRVDIVCGYLVSPRQLRKFADSQGIRYDPGGDVLSLHTRIRSWADNHKIPIASLWEVKHPRLISPTEGDLRILIPTRRRFAAHTFQFKEKDIDRAILQKVLEHPRLSPLAVETEFATCPDPNLKRTLPGEEYISQFSPEDELDDGEGVRV